MSVSQHIPHTRVDNLLHTGTHSLPWWKNKAKLPLAGDRKLISAVPVGCSMWLDVFCTRTLIWEGNKVTLQTPHTSPCPPWSSQRVQSSTCPQDTDWGCGSAQEAEASCRCCWLLPTAGIFWERGDGRGAPGAGGCPLHWLMKAALWSLAGPSWEIKEVCPQIKEPQTEL